MKSHSVIEIRGFLLGSDTPLEPGADDWDREMPTRRGGHKEEGYRQTYGDYFTRIATLLADNDFDVLTEALTRDLGRRISVNDLRAVDIHIEKHGEFYHPARVAVALGEKTLSLVVNGALSPAGQATIEREYHLLTTLGADSAGSVPRAYWLGELPAAGTAAPPQAAFIGEWFEGYHEFHWSRDPSDGEARLVVWDPQSGPRPLPERQVPHLFSRVSEILTGLYDPHTFSQVFPWHHAAGDFVVNDAEDPLDVRLITVRNHVAFLGTEGPPDEDTLFQALLLFFLVTGIRMQLDRLDGTGDLFWAPNMVVDATTRGFFRALGRRRDPKGVTAGWFLERLSVWSSSDLIDIADPLADLIALGPGEAVLIHDHLESHFEAVAEGVQALHRMAECGPEVTAGKTTI